MPLTDPALWKRIQSHPMPAATDGETFFDQLIRTANIRPETAERAIAEYRRFLYLSALNQGRTVPTKAVDAVWHLHLGHTRDYWEKLVPGPLQGRAIHHTPGTPDNHAEDFDRTRDRYIDEFDEPPPIGFWKRRTRADIRREMWGTIAGFGLVCGVSYWMGAPLFAVLFFAVIGGVVVLWLLFSRIRHRNNRDAQIDIAIWADGDAGDCGSGDGGCGGD